ncbi:hypothetical protein [Paracoccus yeei]|uniref:hypothetical protein n=1 Tax=Paracoccus yeei TaxID=147645 RepID=UPI00048F9AC0|nr:hypothetical protein [Paracoccus yeei]OWJ90064.1 hypothetical protein CDV54_17060 [Paracoccus yeei]
MARERKRSAFTARDPGFAARLEMAPAEASEKATAPAEPEARVRVETGAEGLPPAPAPQSPVAGASQGNSTAATAALQPDRQPAPAPPTKDGVPLRINFSWPAGIVERAAAMARDSRCPVRTVLRHIWFEARAGLVDALEAGIPHTAVPAARAVGAGERFDSRLVISHDAHARLAAEIDPKGIAGLSSPLSRWAREQMTGFAAAYLDRAGY